MSRAPGSGFPGFRAADRQAMPEQLRQRCRSYRYGRLACPDLIVRAQLTLPMHYNSISSGKSIVTASGKPNDWSRRYTSRISRTAPAGSTRSPDMILFDSVGSGRLIPSGTTEPPMDWTHVQEIADKKVLYLTTIGRRTGLPREIEIWFVVYRDCFYLFADTGEAAAWIKNIRSSPEVTVRIGEQHFGAVARVLDRDTDRELWDQAAALAERKYGWGDGLLVEISPFPPRTTDT